MPLYKTQLTRHNRLSNRRYNRLYVCLHDTAGSQTGCQTGLATGLTTVLNEQPLFVQPVVRPDLTTLLNEQLFVQPVVKPDCTTGLTTVFNEQPLFIQPVETVLLFVQHKRFHNRLYTRYSGLSNGFDNRLNVCIHDTTGLTTGCIV